MSLMEAPGCIRSVNLILKPTTSPSPLRNSCAMRFAMLDAAIRRGCVWPIIPSIPRPASRQIFGSCVVLPLPVSPQTTITRCFASAARISSRAALIGSSSGYLSV